MMGYFGELWLHQTTPKKATTYKIAELSINSYVFILNHNNACFYGKNKREASKAHKLTTNMTKNSYASHNYQGNASSKFLATSDQRCTIVLIHVPIHHNEF